eukprot:scaffold34630_cov185-Amphora_coffeaeformis.AAC.2
MRLGVVCLDARPSAAAAAAATAREISNFITLLYPNMTPRLESPMLNGDASSKEEAAYGDATIIVREPGKPAYVHCQSKGDFVNPFPEGNLPAAAKNESLNLNLGQKIITPENKFLRWIIRFLNSLCIEWWEEHFFTFWAEKVPLSWRRALTFMAWKIYFPFHKALGLRTGLHKDASAEYHALTTLMWWGRLFPVSVRRMRFSLGQLHVISPAPVQSKIRHVQDDMKDFLPSIPETQKDHVGIRGLFLETSNKPSEWTIFWVYGGAFLSGDAAGNSGPADYIGRACGMDVFLPECKHPMRTIAEGCAE